MNLIPFPYNIIAGVVLVGALAAGTYFAWEHYVANPYRAEGRAEVQGKWDAAIAAQKVREDKARAEAEDFQTRLGAKRDKDYAELARRNKLLEAKLAAISIDGTVASSVRDAIHTANGEGPRSPEEDSAPTTGLALSNWASETTQLYRACRDQIIGWVKWDDERVVQ